MIRYEILPRASFDTVHTAVDRLNEYLQHAVRRGDVFDAKAAITGGDGEARRIDITYSILPGVSRWVDIRFRHAVGEVIRYELLTGAFVQGNPYKATRRY